MTWKEYILLFIMLSLMALGIFFLQGCVNHKYPPRMPIEQVQLLEKQRILKDELVRFMKCCCNDGDNGSCHKMELASAELERLMPAPTTP